MKDWTDFAKRYPESFIQLSNGKWLPVIAGGKGGGSSTTVIQPTIPPKSPEELGLLRKQTELLDIQIAEVRRQNDALQAVFPQQTELLKAQLGATTALAEAQKAQTLRIEALAEQQKPLFEQQIEAQKVLVAEQLPLLREQTAVQRALLAEITKPETPEQKELRELSEKRALAILKGEAPPLSEAQRARIETVFGEAETDAERNLRQFAEELAASRGLRLTDTPIGGEILEQRAELARGLGGAKARAELEIGQSERAFQEGVREFQENLRQRAFMNRLALTGGGGSAQLPLFGVPFGGIGGGFGSTGAGDVFSSLNPILGRLAQERLAGASQTQTTRTSGGGFDPTALFQPVATIAAASLPFIF